VSRRQKRRENAMVRAQGLSEGTAQDAPIPGPEAVHKKRPLGASGESSLLVGDFKRAKVTTSFAEVAASERMAIVPEGYPADKIGLGHLGAIQGLVLELLVDAPDPLPRVTIGNIVAGALHVNCQGRESTAWLRSAIGGAEIAGLRLQVVDAKDLPKPVKMAWRTKIVGGHDVKLLLRVLQRYNPALHTEEWKVVDTAMAEANTRRIILMDRVSAEVIKAAGYQLHTGVDLSTFKLLEDAEERVLEEAEDDKCAGKGEGGQAPEALGAEAPPTGEEAEAEATEEVDEEGLLRSEAGDMAGSSEGYEMPCMPRASSPLSLVHSEDLRGMAELQLDRSMSPMSCDLAVQEEAADLSKPRI
jgi:hypothetical protein